MAYHLIKTNQFNTIPTQYGNLFKRPNLLDPNLKVVVQNNQSATYLKYQLAYSLGVVAGLDMLLPETALRNLILGFDWVKEQLAFDEKQGIGRPALHTPEVKLVIYQYLQNFIGKKEELGPLNPYIAQSKGADKDRKLYNLANQLANLFSLYGMNAPTMMSQWQEGHHGQTQTFNPTESWQAFIYNQLFNIENKAPYRLLSDLMNHLVKHHLPYKGDQGSLILLGSSFLGEGSLNFFRHLSRFISVTHFYIASTEPKDNPTLFMADYGKTASQFQLYIKETLSQEPGFRLTEDYKPYPPSPLGLIQQKIFTDNLETLPLENLQQEQAFKIFATPNVKRQIEVVKDFILNLLDTDPALKAQDIALMAPDINRYASLLEAVFKTDTKLPYNGVDFVKPNTLAEGFLALLSLASSKFSRSALFNLFNHYAFRQAMEISDEEYEVWLTFCEEGQVLWAFDQTHRQNLELGHSPLYSWQHAFDNFNHFLLWGEEESSLTIDSQLYLKNPGVWQAIGHLIDLVTRLYKGFGRIHLKKQSFDKWEAELEYLMRLFLQHPNKPKEDESYWALKRIFSNMRENYQTVDQFQFFETSEFSFDIIKLYLQEATSMSDSHKGQFLRGGVTCSSLKPLRSIPFKVVILLGLDNEHFPATEAEQPSFNLLNHHQEQVLFSLNRADADRYAFIEAIMAAKQQLALFYIAKNENSGELLEPSLALKDFCQFLNPAFKPHSLCYPLHSFDHRLFNLSSSFITSYSPSSYNLSKAYYQGHYEAGYKLAIKTEKPNQNLNIIEVDQIINFFKDPLSYYLKTSLNCSTNPDYNLNEDQDTESDELNYPLTAKASQTLQQQLVLGNLANPSSFITKQIEQWQQFNLLSTSVLSKPLNQKSLQNLTQLAHQAYNLQPLLVGYQSASFTLKPLHFNLNGQPYSLVGNLDNLLVQDQNCLTLTTFTGSNPLKMALPSRFWAWVLQTQQLSYQHFSSYCLNYTAEVYHYKDCLQDQTEVAYTQLQFALQTFLDYQTKPLPLSLEILSKNELDPTKIKTTWQQAYLACYQKTYNDDNTYKKDRPLPDKLLFPNGLKLEDLQPLDEVFEKIYSFTKTDTSQNKE